MSLIGIADDHGTLRTDNVRRAVSAAPNRLRFVKFNDLAVIDISAERPFRGIYIGCERIRGQLHAVRQPVGEIGQERGRGVGRSRLPMR